jgi:membrane peptidoglycan carboxypeptidase
MENVVSKSRILELYINMIEFGPDVYGITQAAKFYFDKTPEQLTPLEGAYLASLKVSPSKGGRFYKSGFPSSGWWPKRMKYILKVLAENGYISPAEVLAAYPWIPQFVYPEPTDIHDARNVWLRNYTEYLLEQSRQKKREEADARQAASDK